MVSKTIEKLAESDRSSRMRILDAAEELFAECGYDATSLRQIALKSGLPVGLVSYHFEGKLGVYRAIFEYRAPAIVEQRKAGLALAELEDDENRRMEMVLKAVFVPLLSLRSAEGSNRLGFLLAREINDPRSEERGIIRDLFDPVAQLVINHLSHLLPERTEAEIHWAYQLVISILVFTMADAGRMSRLSGGAIDPADRDATLCHVIPMLMHGLKSRAKLGMAGRAGTQPLQSRSTSEGERNVMPLSD